MQRLGAVKKEVLIVLFFIVILGGLTVLLTMRQGTTDSQSNPQSEQSGSQTKPQPTVATAAPGVDDKPNQDIPKDQQKTVTTESGLKVIDQRIGGGDKVKQGSQVEVMYTGWLQNGDQLDSNAGKAPYKVTVGVSSVIKGWHEGLVGMHKGGKRKLIIPDHLAWGERGSPPKVPPRAEVTFEIEVVSVTNK